MVFEWLKNIHILLTVPFLFSSALRAQQPAAADISAYVHLLKDKKIGLTTNHSALTGNGHLLDLLLRHDVDVVKIYAPEHGFRGVAGAGEKVGDYTDEITNIPVVSLYGNNRKPGKAQLAGIDCMLFDMQDVGVRFYTYLSTMHYVMEACAENSLPFILLDRPNPNGFYIDGPVLKPECRSFIGMHEIPVVHGMTLGELALMINSEHWLAGGRECTLTVVPCRDYTHESRYIPPVRPSPNLPDIQAILLYPTLCFFEGTPLSVGRGTDFPFKVVGHPQFKGKQGYEFSFVPSTRDGRLKPLFENQTCYGKYFGDFDTGNIHELMFDLIIEIGGDYGFGNSFFKPVFDKLAGNTLLRRQIERGMSAKEIRDSWQNDLEKFKIKRKKYLLYPDFYRHE
jgi:uncharacterized protein YbbC (DUF1343 family)